MGLFYNAPESTRGVYRIDREAVSTARLRLAGQLATADGCSNCLQVGVLRASTAERASTHLARSGVTAHLATRETGVRPTSTSVPRTRVSTTARALMTEDGSPASA